MSTNDCLAIGRTSATCPQLPIPLSLVLHEQGSIGLNAFRRIDTSSWVGLVDGP